MSADSDRRLRWENTLSSSPTEKKDTRVEPRGSERLCERLGEVECQSSEKTSEKTYAWHEWLVPTSVASLRARWLYGVDALQPEVSPDSKPFLNKSVAGTE